MCSASANLTCCFRSDTVVCQRCPWCLLIGAHRQTMPLRGCAEGRGLHLGQGKGDVDLSMVLALNFGWSHRQAQISHLNLTWHSWNCRLGSFKAMMSVFSLQRGQLRQGGVFSRHWHFLKCSLQCNQPWLMKNAASRCQTYLARCALTNMPGMTQPCVLVLCDACHLASGPH